MDAYKYQLGTLCLLLLPLSVAGQEWSKQDSLRLQQTLNSEQEIRINKVFVKKTEQNMLYHTNPLLTLIQHYRLLNQQSYLRNYPFILITSFDRPILLSYPLIHGSK